MLQPPKLAQAIAGLDEGIQKLGPLVTLTLAAIDLEVARANYDAALQRLQPLEWGFAAPGELACSAGRHPRQSGAQG